VSAFEDHAVLLTGASGYLGRVLAAELLASTSARLVLPLRSHHEPPAVAQAIADEHPDLTQADVLRRARFCTLPPSAQIAALLPACGGVRGIVHAAGSVSYFDRVALQEGNEQLTGAMIALGQQLQVEQFSFVSTAFSSGYRAGRIDEQLHALAGEDPTDYTASKRRAEHLVAASGLPWLIARPSIIIGDSRTGRYSGRPYGIYQLWRGFERLLSDAWQPTAHAVASDRPLQLVHQDAVAKGLVAAMRDFVPGRVLHLVSDPAALPTARQAWGLWFREVVQPERVCFHRSVEQAERGAMTTRQRLFMDFTATNLEIAEHSWQFETTGLRQLQAAGCALPPVTVESLRTCQRAFVAQSPRLRAYLARLNPEAMAR